MSDCPDPEPTDQSCPNLICCDQFADLPNARRMRIFGAERGKSCLTEFPPTAKGFVIADGNDFIVTERPCVEIPVERNYAQDPETGEFIQDADGGYKQMPLEGWPYMIMTGEEGCQNRFQGLNGIPANVHWDGCKFVLQATEDTDQTIDDFNQYEGWCGIYEAVIKVEQACDPLKGYVQRARVGYRPKPAQPYGAVQMYAGTTLTIPDGWVLCDGGSYSRSAYPHLFDAIGVSHGGSGNSFNVPDMRGMFPRGVDGAQGNDPDAAERTAPASGGNSGDEVGSVQGEAVQCHLHGVSAEYNLEGTVELGYESTTTGALGGEAAYGPDRNHGTKNVSVDFTDDQITIDEQSPQPCEGADEVKTSLTETRPKNIGLNFIIFAGCEECVEAQ